MTTTPNQPDRERAAEQAIRKLFEERAEEYGNWITDVHEETGVWSYEGEIPTQDIVRVVAAALAFRDADRAGEGEDDATIAEFAFLYRQYGLAPDEALAPDAIELKRKVLAALSTPATPLLDDETVERCAEVAEEMLLYAAQDIATALRALKGSARQEKRGEGNE